jgi:Zn-dependent protease
MLRRLPRASVAVQMPGRSYRIARIAGIPVGVSPWWLAIVALITWSLGASYFPEAIHGIGAAASYGLGLASALLLFVSILAHEFGHAIVARRHGIEIEEIDLWLLGGVSRMRGEAHEPSDELRYALAGPLVTLAIAVGFALAAVLLPASTPAVVEALVAYQALVNGLILVFNLLPAFPLDGGRVLRSLLWRRSGDRTHATETAAKVGRGFGYLMIALGAVELLSGEPAGLWLALIGFFIVVAARAEVTGAEVRAALTGVPACELMSSPVVSIPAEMPVAEAAELYVHRYPYAAFPVVDVRGVALGLVGAAQVRLRSPRHGSDPLASVADRDPGLLIGADDDVAALLSNQGFLRVGRAVVVDAGGRPIGLPSITDVTRTLDAARRFDGSDRGHVPLAR